MSASHWLILFPLALDVLALRDVLLTIKPSIVQKNHPATLQCSYDLDQATLYYVKWYRGSHEFYRFTPSEQPCSKVFPIPGINVDINHSNSTQVRLLDIDFNISGKFSCEVTTAEEPAKTSTNAQTMVVVQLPEYSPKITVGREPLDYGDTLRANCSSPPARPPATLKFILNNMTVAITEPFSPAKSAQKQQWSDLSLDLVLSEIHFDRGRLILQCVARLAEVYHEEAVLELESARHPVPEKVSAESTSPLFRQTVNHVLLLNLLLVLTS